MPRDRINSDLGYCASQAGKGLFQRQEIQDLIALTRVLVQIQTAFNSPLVGLTEEELLDIVWSLPPAADPPDSTYSPEREHRRRLYLSVSAASITHARDILEKLQVLGRKANATTPHALLYSTTS